MKKEGGSMMFCLKDQVAIVTGGAKGIGRGICEMLKKAGADVVICDIDEKTGRETARQLEVDFYPLDVADSQKVTAVFEKVVEKYGKLDILCANTGIYPQTRLADMTETEWDNVMNVNLKGMFLTVKKAAELMKERSYGRIILTSSITGPITGYPGWSHYGASKAGNLGFMRSVALEYAKYGITINAVQPGNIATEGLAEQGEDYLKEMEKTIPTHELGEPEDIGTAAVFFASKEAKFITGQALVIDGGQILPESPDALL